MTMLSFSYSLSGNTTYQGFPFPGKGKVGDAEFIRIHNIGQQLTAAHTSDSCYWDAFNAAMMFGHLGHLRYAGTIGVTVNIPGPIDLPPGAYLGWTFNGNDANSFATAWVIYEIIPISPASSGYPTAAGMASATATAKKCDWLGRIMGECEQWEQ